MRANAAILSRVSPAFASVVAALMSAHYGLLPDKHGVQTCSKFWRCC